MKSRISIVNGNRRTKNIHVAWLSHTTTNDDLINYKHDLMKWACDARSLSGIQLIAQNSKCTIQLLRVNLTMISFLILEFILKIYIISRSYYFSNVLFLGILSSYKTNKYSSKNLSRLSSVPCYNLDVLKGFCMKRELFMDNM